MNFKKFSELLNSNNNVQVQIVKKSQIYGHHQDGLFLTNRSNHPHSSYPITSDTTKWLDPGKALKVLSAHPANTVFGPSCIKVADSDHTFYIMQSDFKRYIKIM